MAERWQNTWQSRKRDKSRQHSPGRTEEDLKESRQFDKDHALNLFGKSEEERKEYFEQHFKMQADKMQADAKKPKNWILQWSGNPNHMGPQYFFDDEYTGTNGAFWKKDYPPQMSRPVAFVAAQSLHQIELQKHQTLSDGGLADPHNFDFYWDKKNHTMVEIKDVDDSVERWISQKYNGVTVHGKIIQANDENFYLCFWNMHHYFFPLPLTIGNEPGEPRRKTELGTQLCSALQKHLKRTHSKDYTEDLVFKHLQKLVFIAELTTADLHSHEQDPMGRKKLGEVTSYCGNVMNKKHYPNCFETHWKNYTYKNYIENYGPGTPFGDSPELQFKLIGAFKMGHYTTGQSVIYKFFQDVKTREVTGVKWTRLVDKNHYTAFITEQITKFPNLEGFIMELGNKKLCTRVSEHELNDDDADDEPDTNYVCIAVIKLKCTSRTQHLMFKECNENGKNEHTPQVPVAWRAKWRIGGKNSKTRWVRIMNFNSDRQQSMWKRLWGSVLKDDYYLPAKDVKNAYFIYATVGPDAQPEFCVPGGINVRAGDIYTQKYIPDVQAGNSTRHQIADTHVATTGDVDDSRASGGTGSGGGGSGGGSSSKDAVGGGGSSRKDAVSGGGSSRKDAVSGGGGSSKDKRPMDAKDKKTCSQCGEYVDLSETYVYCGTTRRYMHFDCLQKDENGNYAKCFQCNDIVTQFDKHCDITNRWVHYNCWLRDKSDNYATCTLCGGIVLGKDERYRDKIDDRKYVHVNCAYVPKTDETDHTMHDTPTGMHLLISNLQRCNPYAV